ncbi:MAG: mechanosensitive ion channel family protein [Oscillospiraceae bacterium]|nr:mechanosensitive ion channel family protein [Oscillospiraceae bacterium]
MEELLAKMGLESGASLVSAILLFLICWGLIKILTAVTDRLFAKARRLDATLSKFLRKAIHVLLWVLAGILIANALGVNTASLVALLSVVGLALSLSIQNVTANLFSGVTLLATKPFIAGDFVEVAGRTGRIKAVGLFYTELDTADNVAVSIPNGDVTASAINNYSREPLRRVDQYFSASYDDDTETVRAAILEAAAEDEKILQEPAPFVRLSAYEASSVKYVCRVWCRNADYWEVLFGMNERVRESFRRHGVQMSYEHVNVHLVEK